MAIFGIIILILIILAGIGCYCYVAWNILSQMGATKCVDCPLQEDCYRSILTGNHKLCDIAKPLEK